MMSEFLRKYGILFITVVIVLAVLVSWAALRKGSPRPAGNINLAFYVDEETNEESIRSVDEIPPLEGKEHKRTVVRAMKYSLPDGKETKTVYLLKYTPEAQAKLVGLSNSDLRRSQIMADGELVRLPESGSPWVLSVSNEGQRIRELADKLAFVLPTGK